jgi:ADP-ribose pyrophosphatase YjhB (NUDIX family)
MQFENKLQLTSNDSCGAIIIKKCGNSFLENETVIVQGIKKKGFSFPKGHLEGNETPLETCYREIYEECGLTKEDYQIISEIGSIHVRPGRQVFLFLAELKSEKFKMILEPFDKTQTDEAKFVTLRDLTEQKPLLKGGQFEFLLKHLEFIKSKLE